MIDRVGASTDVEPRLPPRPASAEAGPVAVDANYRDLAVADGIRPAAMHAPYRPPVLRSTRPMSALLLVARLAMLVWAVSSALALRDSDAIDRQSVPSIWIGAAIGVAWLLAGGWWSYVRTINVRLLDGRFPTMTRSVASWVYVPLWVGLMSVTLIPASPNPDFDVRPIIIVGGFALTMMAPYRLVHRILKSLLRVPPTAACVAFYVLDVTAFGLLWWRATSWSTDRGDGGSFDIGVIVAATVALIGGAALTWHLDRSVDAAQRTRVVTLRTRHDHRIARLCGLDPMDPATRRALLVARQAAVRTAANGAGDVPTDDLVTLLAAEIDEGVTAGFAERVRLLALRTDGLVVVRHHHDDIAPSRADDRPSRSIVAPRLYLAEALRYVVIGLYAVSAIACLAFVVGFERNDTWTADLARDVLVWGAALAHVATAGWATSVARGAQRVGAPGRWRLPLGAAIATALVATLWITRNGALTDGEAVVAFMLLTAGIELALWRIIVLDELFVFRHADSPLQAWMSIAPATFGLLLVSPVRAPLEYDEPGGRIAFFATLIGLASALSGSMAAITMVQLEDGIRASTLGLDGSERESATPVDRDAGAAPASDQTDVLAPAQPSHEASQTDVAARSAVKRDSVNRALTSATPTATSDPVVEAPRAVSPVSPVKRAPSTRPRKSADADASDSATAPPSRSGSSDGVPAARTRARPRKGDATNVVAATAASPIDEVVVARTSVEGEGVPDVSAPNAGAERPVSPAKRAPAKRTRTSAGASVTSEPVIDADSPATPAKRASSTRPRKPARASDTVAASQSGSVSSDGVASARPRARPRKGDTTGAVADPAASVTKDEPQRVAGITGRATTQPTRRTPRATVQDRHVSEVPTLIGTAAAGRPVEDPDFERAAMSFLRSVKAAALSAESSAGDPAARPEGAEPDDSAGSDPGGGAPPSATRDPRASARSRGTRESSPKRSAPPRPG